MAVGTVLTLGSLAAQAFSSYKNAENEKKIDAKIRNMDKSLESWYNSESNKDFLDQTENKSTLKRLRERIDEDNKRVEKTAAITGASNAKVNAAKERNNKTVADVMNRMAGRGTAYRQNLRNMYRGDKRALQQQQFGRMDATTRSWQNIASNTSNLAGAAMKAESTGAFDDWFKKDKKN